MIRKSFEDNKQNIPNKLKTNKRTYSKDFKIDSYFKKSFDTNKTKKTDNKETPLESNIKLSFKKLNSKKKNAY